MLPADDPAASVSTYEQENTCKLNEEDKERLKSFFSTAKTYRSSLYSIYSKYASSYNTIATYGSCGDYNISCFSQGPSGERSKALAALEKLKLKEEYSKLSKMLKNAVPGYKGIPKL
ncbi:hypothetical protein F0310_05670 (plasmid) [Borrelia sp. A-FGy1]|uniref:hypothetical protein n=1 Tax=Borrelia sp. A-FGy1 TaxID=2608247 RepID=UPI0015F773B7|nr:hypothetical protein [Borrelia sp. A-FGy1]QMU99894.1 hypothetical protein F0310_05670 [Borrelia sp. A-FGy1]